MSGLTALTTVEQLIDLRRARWNGDVAADSHLVDAIARRILATPTMRAEVRRRPHLLIAAVMQVVDKQQQVVPFFPNQVQQAFLSAFERYGAGQPYFVLKGRQQGFTTLITAMQLCHCLARHHQAGFTLADNMQNMNAIFADKAKALWERLPACLKPHAKYNSRRELVFDRLDSSWRVGAAGDNLGRSRTLHFVHYSEVAFYRCRLHSLQRSIGEALTADSVQIYETTANGWNEAKDLWDSGTCHNLFYAWWLSPEYAMDGEERLYPQDEWLRSRLQWLAGQGLTERQLNWYANKYRSYLDKHAIMQEYPCTPEEAWVTGGDCYFDRDGLLAALSAQKPTQRVGYFRCSVQHPADGEEGVADVQWVDDPTGCITLHEPPRTRMHLGRRQWAAYALGGDTAGEGSDWYAAKVVDADTLATVATLHIQHTDDDLYARQIYCLGLHYNQALVGLEINYSLAPTRLLQRWGYPNLYMREKWDALVGAVSMRAGFCTNAQTRPVILSNLQSILRDNPLVEPDRATLLELLSFMRNAMGRPEAAGGRHDDLVMSLAIAHHVAGQGAHGWQDVPEAPNDWIAQHFHCD